MAGDPVYGVIRQGRTCYLSDMRLQELASRPGWIRVCKLGPTITSIELPGRTWAKRAAPWGTYAEWEQAASWWTTRGLHDPASPSGLVRMAAPQWYRGLSWSLAAPLWPGVRGGWQEAKVRGKITGPHRVLDLRRAYRWALEQTGGMLPDRRGYWLATQFIPFRHGLHLVTIDPCDGAPWPFNHGGRVLIECPRDLERWRMRITAWHGGVYCDRWLPVAPLAELIDSIGVSAAQRGFWGPWIAQVPVETHYRSGKVTRLPTRSADPIRAHLITARVRERVNEIDASYRYVDSVITRETRGFTLGERPGQWRVVREYPQGVHVYWPGAYGPIDGPPDKMSGVPREGVA